MGLIRDNRGSEIPIALLLVLVFVLGVAILGAMIVQNSKISEELDFANIQQLKVMEKQSEYLIKNVAEFKAVESYADIVNGKGYAGDDCEVKNGVVVFCGLNKDIDGKFKDIFKTRLIESFPDEFLVSKESLSVVISGGQVEVKAFFEVSKSGGLNVNYSWKEENSFSLNELGLDYFDEIYRGVEKCKAEESSVEGMQECLKFSNFDITVSKTSDGFLVKLDSKKKFVFGGEYNSLGFSFLI